MNDNQLEILKSKVKEIKKAEWDIEVPSSKIKNREWLKSQIN